MVRASGRPDGLSRRDPSSEWRRRRPRRTPPGALRAPPPRPSSFVLLVLVLVEARRRRAGHVDAVVDEDDRHVVDPPPLLQQQLGQRLDLVGLLDEEPGEVVDVLDQLVDLLAARLALATAGLMDGEPDAGGSGDDRADPDEDVVEAHSRVSRS